MGWFSKKEEIVDDRAAAGSGLRLFIQKMDPGGVRAALSAGASPDGSPEDDISPIVQVATSFASSLPTHRRAQKEILVALLEAGANPSWGGRNGQSPFEVTVKKGWEDIVELMVSKGHSVENIEGLILTPLQVALSPVDYKGQSLIPIVKKLIALGADPNNAGKTNRSPLVFALMQAETLKKAEDYESLLETLVNSGASLSDQSPHGDSVEALLVKADLPHLWSRWT